MWVDKVKMQSFRIPSNLSCYQLKIDSYTYKLLYVSLMVTTKQKPTGDIFFSNYLLSKYVTKESKK